jgi:hypothetical protein
MHNSLIFNPRRFIIAITVTFIRSIQIVCHYGASTGIYVNNVMMVLLDQHLQL